MNKELSVELTEVDGTTICSVIGRLDASTAGLLNDKIHEFLLSSRAKLLFDLSALTYISSAGVKVMLYTGKRMQAQRGQLVICSARVNVKKVLEVAVLDNIFSVYDSRDTALKALKSNRSNGSQSLW